MRTIGIGGFVLLVVAMFAAPPGARAHDLGFTAGEPGDPKKPARTVTIKMREEGQRQLFIPDRVEVKRNEQIRFVLVNEGIEDHEFVLDSTEGNLKHAEDMKKNPDMEHDDPNALRLKPEKQGELVWKFSKRGTFEYACLIPGHREDGMVGTVIVK